MLAPRHVPPAPGQPSRGMRLAARRASEDQATLLIEAPPGRHALPVILPGRHPRSVRGATLAGSELELEISGEPGRYEARELVLDF
ncbi:MAG: hypothetical protein ACE5F1_01130 [Planctomycetota bacterium]